jgi:hypothetical protein
MRMALEMVREITLRGRGCSAGNVGVSAFQSPGRRRRLASFQIVAGAPLEVIQKTLGHESKTTTEIYARMALETVRASVERATEEMLKAVTKSPASGCESC